MKNIVIAWPRIIFINAKDNSTIETCLDILSYKKKNNIIKFTCSYPYEFDNSLLLDNEIKIKIVFNKYNIDNNTKVGEYAEKYNISAIERYVSKATCNTTAVVKFIINISE